MQTIFLQLRSLKYTQVKTYLSAVFTLFFCLFVEAHSEKVNYRIIIDTDGAADDLRAICMLLGNREVETLAITTSEGALTPLAAAKKANALLHDLCHEDVPVGVGRHIEIAPPAWRKQSERIKWGSALNIYVPVQNAVDLITETLKGEEGKITFVCLGALTNVNDALAANPALKEKIERVIWYNSSARPLKGANYNADRASANKALMSGLRVEIVSGEDWHETTIDEQYINTIARLDNRYAKKIARTHNKGVLQPVTVSNHMKMWDDLAVVYLFAPELFNSVNINKTTTINSLINAGAGKQVKEIAVDILRQTNGYNPVL